MVKLRAHQIRQIFKWTIYTLLFVNFVFYVREEIFFAEHTLPDGASFLEWINAYATTIDEFAWFLLIALFELETYVLSDDSFEGTTESLVHGCRIVCYVFIAHTVFAWSTDIIELEDAKRIDDIAGVCDLVDRDLSFARNLQYSVIDEQNCAQLSTESELYLIEKGEVVTDSAGLRIERELAWGDLIEAIAWLLIVLSIELTVRLQNRDMAAGPMITLFNYVKLSLAAVLIVVAAYWGYRGHWLYVWDEFVWMAGFAVIEMNIFEWRDEIRDSQEVTVSV